MKMFLFDRNQQVRRWLKDDDFIEATLVEQINATGELTFSLPYKKSLAGGIFFAGIPSPCGDGYLLFKLIKERKLDDRIEYQGIEAAYDELRSYHYIKDVRPKNESAGYMLQRALEGTRWQTGVVYGNQEASTNFYYVNTLEAIQKIVEIFGVEVTFTITLDPKTNRITRRQVNLYAQQGRRTGKRFEYGSNLLSVTREEVRDGLVTALIGRGKGEQVSEGDEQTPDGYGRRIDFADVVWSTKNGNPVDKPAGQIYVEDKNATAQYGFDDGSPRIGLQVFEDIEDKNELLKATWAALQTLKRPKVSFKADVLDVGSLGLGDTVAIIRHDLHIEYFTRVYKVTHNLLNERLNTIELGDDFSGDSITRTVSTVAGAVRDAQESVNQAIVSANAKNTNYYGSDQPSTAAEGDLWYKDLGNGETDMMQYHNGAWITLQSTRTLNLAKKAIDEQIKALEDRVKKSQTDQDEKQLAAAKAEAANALQQAKADTANLKTEINGKLESFQNDETALKKSLADTNGNLSNLTVKVGEISNSVVSAQGVLNQIKVDVNGISTTASNNKDLVSKLQVKVDGINTTVSNNSNKITNIQTDINGIRNLVSNKVDNATMTSYVDQKADSWTLQVKKSFSNQEGVNLLTGTGDWSGVWNNDYDGGSNDYDGFELIEEPDSEGNFQAKVTNYINRRIFLKKGTYTLSANVKPTSKVFDMGPSERKVVTYTSIYDKNKIQVNAWQRLSCTFEVLQDGYADIAFDAYPNTIISSPKLEKGSKATAWSPNPADYGGINNVISKINVEAGSILIDSDKLYLSANTTVFKGNAFIPNAAIVDLSADKINTGTLDAGVVDVINLNASKITTGKLNAAIVDIVGKSASIKMSGDSGMDIIANNGSWTTSVKSGRLTFEQKVNGKIEKVGGIYYGGNIEHPEINGISVVIATQQKLGAPYGGDNFVIGTATKKHDNGEVAEWSTDFSYNGNEQKFTFFKDVHFSNYNHIWFDGSKDPFLVRNARWNNSGNYYPVLQVGYSEDTQANSGIAYRWGDIKPFGYINSTHVSYTVDDANGTVRFSWVSWSDWTQKIISLARDDNGGGIAFGGDGNVILFGGNRRWNLYNN